MAYDYVKRAYGVNPIVGERVRHQVTKKLGTIKRRGESGHYVYVLFDGGKQSLPCHPTEIDYLGTKP